MKLHRLAANYIAELKFVEHKKRWVLWVRVKIWLCLLE